MAVISKGEFARRRNVTPGRVSQWLAAGQISGAAIVGEGRNAGIDEVLACQQLDHELHIDQRHGNGIGTNLTPTGAVNPSPGPALPLPDPSTANTLSDKIAEQRLEQLQRSNRQAKTEEAATVGRLCDTIEARQATGREIARVVARVEGSLTELASAIAAKFKLPHRDVLHELRGEWRKIRQNAAIEARERGEPMPETTGFDLGET